MNQTRLLTGFCEGLWRGRKDSWLFRLVDRLLPVVHGQPDQTLVSLLNAFSGVESPLRDVPMHCVLDQALIPNALDAMAAGAVCVLPERFLVALTAISTGGQSRGGLMIEAGGGVIAAYGREYWLGAGSEVPAGCCDAKGPSGRQSEAGAVAEVSAEGAEIEIERDALHEISCCIAPPAQGLTRLRVEQSGRLDQTAIAISKGLDLAASATWPVSAAGHLPLSYEAASDGVVLRYLVWLETGRRTRVRITHGDATETMVPVACRSLMVRSLNV